MLEKRWKATVFREPSQSSSMANIWLWIPLHLIRCIISLRQFSNFNIWWHGSKHSAPIHAPTFLHWSSHQLYTFATHFNSIALKLTSSMGSKSNFTHSFDLFILSWQNHIWREPTQLYIGYTLRRFSFSDKISVLTSSLSLLNVVCNRSHNIRC